MTDPSAQAPSSPPAGAPMPVSAPGIARDRMVVLFLVMLVAAAGNTAMQSLLPAIGTRLAIPDVWVSLAFSWSALLWVLTAPYWAEQSDRRGRRALMRLGMAGFVASMGLCGAALWAGLDGWLGAGATFVAFAVFRSLYGGLGSAAPPAVQAYVAARTPPAGRTQALALLSSSFGLGTVIGPAIAPFLIVPGPGLAAPLFAFAVLGLIVMLAVRWRLPDDAPRYAARGVTVAYPLSAAPAAADADDEDTPPAALPPHPKPRARIAWSDTRVRPWFVAGLVGGQAQAMLLGVIGFLVMDRLSLRAMPEAAADPIGLVLMAGAIASLLAQWGLIPLLAPGPRASVVWGAVLAGVGLAITGMATSLHGLAVGFSIASLGFGLFRPGFTAGASLAVPRAEQNAVAGATASINGAAYIAAPAIGVAIYGASAATAFGLMAALAFGLAAWAARRLA